MEVSSITITQTWADAIDGWLLQMTCDGFGPTTTRSRKSAAKAMARCMMASGAPILTRSPGPTWPAT